MRTSEKRKLLSIILLLTILFVGCSQRGPEQSLFDQQMDNALALALQCGPITESIARQAADAFDGEATDIDYKSREYFRILQSITPPEKKMPAYTLTH